MKKLVGFLILAGLLCAAFFLLKDCNSSGGGNTPLASLISGESYIESL